MSLPFALLDHVWFDCVTDYAPLINQKRLMVELEQQPVATVLVLTAQVQRLRYLSSFDLASQAAVLMVQAAMRVQVVPLIVLAVLIALIALIALTVLAEQIAAQKLASKQASKQQLVFAAVLRLASLLAVRYSLPVFAFVLLMLVPVTPHLLAY